MGRLNFLIEGVSTSGKTSVGEELARRGHHVVHGDRELAYQGDPSTGSPTPGHSHQNHIWDEKRVRSIAADETAPATFFCGGSRNFHRFLDVFDEVFVLEIDSDTLEQRLKGRPLDEFGSKPEERALVRHLHFTREDIPREAVSIDSTLPVMQVVDRVLAAAGSPQPALI